MAEHYDALETRTQQARETAWMQALPVQVAHAQVHAPAFVSSLAGVKADEVNSLAALARLPVVRKQELMDMQKAARAVGGRPGDRPRGEQQQQPPGRQPPTRVTGIGVFCMFTFLMNLN